jgi:MFS family permease
VTLPGTRRDIVAPAGLFLGFGVIAASWVSRIPAVQADLALGVTRLGLALLGLPVGAVVASVFVPRLVRGDGRNIVVAAMPAAALSLAVPGLATDLLGLTAALVVFGVATGALDVSLNTYASHLERALGRSIFGRLHGMWSLGALAGAGIGTAAAAGHVSPRTHFVFTGLALAAATAPLLPLLRGAGTTPSAESHHERGWSRDPAVVAFAAVALAGLIVEVAASDWGGVFVRTVVDGGATASAAAFAVFAALHLLVRLLGDRFVNRDSRSGLLVVALAISAAGMLLLATSTTTAVAYVSLAVIGAGVSLVFPVALAGAGQIAGVSSAAGVATAAGTSYVGWAATPPVIGVLAGAVGLRVALLVPAALALAALVVLARGRRDDTSPMHTGSG